MTGEALEFLWSNLYPECLYSGGFVILVEAYFIINFLFDWVKVVLAESWEIPYHGS